MIWGPQPDYCTETANFGNQKEQKTKTNRKNPGRGGGGGADQSSSSYELTIFSAMKIPPPPLTSPSVYPADGGGSRIGDDNEVARRGEGHIDAYHGYYGSAAHPGTGDGDGVEGQAVISEAAARQTPQQDFSGQRYYDYYGNPPQTMYDPGYDQQHAERAEEDFDQSYGRRLEQSEDQLLGGEVAAAQLMPSSTKELILPNLFSLAQKLLPTVMKRLGQREPMLIEEYEDDFAGHCSPLGTPVNKTATFSSSEGDKTIHSPYHSDNLKTTGLEESDLVDEEGAAWDAAEAGGKGSADIGGIDREATKYLPRSAALLVSALQNSARDVRKYPLSDSLASCESLDNFYKSALSPQSEKQTLEMESQADALLESIRQDRLGGSRSGEKGGEESGAVRGSTPSRVTEGPWGEGAVAVPNNSAAFFGECDDESLAGSIGGDMDRLNQSIANIQRDLENVDFSHLDDVYDDGSTGAGDGGLAARIRLWLSRGTIMEQKLLNTYIQPMGGASGDGEGGGINVGGYTDNPVLVWSLALMWSFVVLILMHPKVAELVEGNDEGQLADIVEWLFG